MITVEDTLRSYSGQSGCMCGCRGNYNDSPRVRKMMLHKLLKLEYTVELWPNETDGTMGCIFHDDGNRNNVLYIRKGATFSDEMLERVSTRG